MASRGLRCTCAVLACLSLAVEVSPSAEGGEGRLDTPLRLLLRAQRPGTLAREGMSVERAGDVLLRLRGPMARPERAAEAGAPRLLLIVKHVGEPEALQGIGFRIHGRIGSIFTGSLDEDRLGDLSDLTGVVFVQSSRRLSAPPFPTRSGLATMGAATGPRGAAAIREGSAPRNLTGAGALIGYIDTGVDVFHQDFRKADGSTRIKFLLDLSDPGDADADGDLDGAGPFGGTLYTEAQINTALAGGSIGQRDTTGHGTHGLSAAAGDDATQPGVAPAADLVVVKATREDGTLGFESADVIDALAFVDEKATELGRPYVANLSLGTIGGSHDGRSLEEQAIDTLVGPGIAGKVVVVAAGNASDNRGTRYRHFRGTSFSGFAQASSTHGLVVPAYTANPGRGNDRVVLSLWQKGRDQNRITVTGPGCPPVTAVFGDYQDEPTACGDVFIANMGGASPLNGDVESVVIIDDWSGTAPRAGNWTITVTGEEIGDTGVYDGWLGEESVVGAASPYLSGNADNQFLVGKPGGAYHAITVGSQGLDAPGTRYRTSWVDVNGIGRADTSAVNGDISDFSSPGGTRDGRVKPEVVAPGERVLGAVSRDAMPAALTSIYRFHPFPEATALLTDQSENHAFGMLQGTSFAAPVVSGLVARILGESPSLDAIQVRNVLINSATVDTFVTAGGTRPVPNPIWGYGKALTSVGGAPLPSTLRITTDTVPSGVLNQPYEMVFTAAGGTLPYTWSRSAGAFPPGLALSGSLLSGAPVAPAGTYNFTIRVQDASSPTPRVATRAYTLVVGATSPLRVTTPGLPPARVGRSYAEPLAATGGAAPYTWTVVGGSLPAGLSLAGGVVQGTPTGIEKAVFTVRATDAANATAYRSLSLRVLGPGGDDWTALGYFAPTVTQIAVDPNDPDRLFSSTEQLDGIFVTTDGGETWRAVGTEKTSLGGINRSAETIRISPTTSDAFIVETGYEWTDAQNQNSRWTEQVYRFDPQAEDWVLWGFPCATDYPPIPSRLDGLDVDAAGTVNVLSNGITCPSFPLGATQPRLLRSVNQGVSWTSPGGIAAGLGSNSRVNRASLSIAPSDPSRMYASRTCRTVLTPCDAPESTFTSADGGVSWTDVTGGVTGIIDVRASSANPLDVVRAGPNFVERSLNGGANWTRVNLPGGGTIRAMDRGRSSPELLLVAKTSGLYKSEDHGQTWAEVLISGRRLFPSSVAVDPADANRLWVGDTLGVFGSSDRGATWSLRSSGLVQRQLERIAINPSAPDELILTGTGGPYLSRSGGDKWVSIGGMGGTAWWPVFPPTAPNRYYMGAWTEGLYRSDNRGVTWYQPNPAFGGSGSTDRIVALDGDPTNPDVLLAARCDGNIHPCQTPGARLSRSTDGGVTWNPLPGTGISSAALVRALAFARDVANRVYLATSAGVYRSSDGGTNWALYGGAFPSPNIRGFAPAPSNSNYVYAGEYFFDPGVGTWQLGSATGVTFFFPQFLAVDPTNPLVAYGGQVAGTGNGASGLLKTVDGGRNWAPVGSSAFPDQTAQGIAVHPTRPATVYVATWFAGVFRSDDAGATWRDLSEYGTVADMVNVNVEDPSNPSLLLAGTAGYGVQASTDRGVNYVPRVTGLTNIYVNAIAFDPDTPSTVYAATDGGLFKSTDSAGSWAPTSVTGRVTDVATHNEGVAHRVWATVSGQGVAYSGDTGTSFTVYSSGLESLQLTGLEVESTGVAHRVWATTSGGSGVAFSDDNGLTWRPAAGNGLTDRDVTDLAVSGGTAHRVWATTKNGVYFSADGGTTWNSVSLGLPSGVPVTSVAIDPNSQEVLVSLSSKEAGGVFRGASVTGVWSAYNRGLDELRVRNVSRGSSRTVDATTKATSFYAATSGAGVFASELRTVTSNPPAIATTSLPDGTVRVAYSVNLAANGGTPPYTWSVPGGSLPPGLVLDSSSGKLAGEPGQAGTFGFTVQVADAGLRTAARGFSIRVLDPTPRLSVGDTLVGFKPTGSVTADVPVTLSPASNQNVSVSYVTADGTALAGTHYVARNGNLTFTPGETAKTVSVTVIGGVPPGQSRSFYLNLSNPVNAPIDRGQGIATIVNGDLFYTLSPCRVVDTRSGDAPALTSGATRIFNLSQRCGIPATARALSLNVTVTSPSAPGFLTLFPTGGSPPLASSINYAPGQTRANNAILSVDDLGRLSVACGQGSGTVHLILDVNGYLE